MAIKKGLTVDGFNYFSDLLSGNKKPDWMDFSLQIAKLTGKYEIVNLMSGLNNLDTFLFRTPKWPIGGMYFDGIMRTEHTSRIRPTQYPVQTGVTMTDHAIIEPAELTVEVMMSDCSTDLFSTNNPILDNVYQSLKKIILYSNYMGLQCQLNMPLGQGRAAYSWLALKRIQLSRMPITVETRLQTYDNMLIEELSAPDDVKTLNAFKCAVRLREVIVAYVSEAQVSARAAATQSTNGGQIAAQSGGVDKTALKASGDAVLGGD